MLNPASDFPGHPLTLTPRFPLQTPFSWKRGTGSVSKKISWSKEVRRK